MRCAKCGTESKTGKKFCAECGNTLSNRCAKCGSDNAFEREVLRRLRRIADCRDAGGDSCRSRDRRRARHRACRSIRARDGERKTVTALFADIKGSMDLMEELDPEEARAIVDPALKLMIDAMHRYDGYIVQSTGDGIFALFGAPVAHEDHPQRATLRGAARCRRRLRAIRPSACAHDGRRAGSRFASGSTPAKWSCDRFTPTTRTAEYTPIGHTMSLAARMQTLAPTGRDRNHGAARSKLIEPATSCSSRWGRRESRASASRSMCTR